MEHSLRKWKGARKEVLKEYGLSRDGFLITTGETVLSFRETSCALCQVHNSNCDECEIKLSRGRSCGSEFRVFAKDGNPEPMIKLLEQTIQWYDRKQEEEAEAKKQAAPVIGKLYRFWNSDEDLAAVGELIEHDPSREYPYKVAHSKGQVTWRMSFKELDHPGLLQMTPWKGGDCPHGLTGDVLYRMRDGKTMVRSASGLRWKHIDNYDDILWYLPL
jgi:hypothetical protein